MTKKENAVMYMTRGGVSYTFDELAKFATYAYDLEDEEARSLIRLSAYLSQRMVPYRPIIGEDISEAAGRIMICIKRSIEEALRGLPSTYKSDEKSTAIQEGVDTIHDNSTPETYCVKCDSTYGFTPVDLWACRCGYEFDDLSDYCPRCDRDCRIDHCSFKCDNCGHYIPE